MARRVVSLAVALVLMAGFGSAALGAGRADQCRDGHGHHRGWRDTSGRDGDSTQSPALQGVPDRGDRRERRALLRGLPPGSYYRHV